MVVRSIFLLLIAFATSILAEPTLSVQVAPHEGTQSDIFTLEIVVSGAGQIRAPMLSGGEKFFLRLGATSSEQHIGSGGVTSRHTYRYSLIPKESGSLNTPEVEVEADGTTLRHPGEVIEVKEGASNPSLTDQQGAVFLRQSISSESAYIGQQIMHTELLFFKVDLSQPKRAQPPFDGFWVEQLEGESRSSKMVGSEQYAVLESRAALFPLKIGRLSIPERQLEAKIEKEVNDPFGQQFPGIGFGGFFRNVELIPITVSAPAISLEVRALPPRPEGIPSSSVQLVGETKIKLSHSLDVVQVGASKGVSIELRSEGNLAALEALPIKESEDLKVYSERPETKRNTNGATLLTTKTFRYSVVPTKPGLVRLPAIEIPYFDPKSGTWKVARSEPIAFAVEGQALPTARAQSKIESASEDLQVPESKSSYYAWYLALFIILAGVVWFLWPRKLESTHSSARALRTLALERSDTPQLIERHLLALIGMALELGENPIVDEIIRTLEERGAERSKIIDCKGVFDELQLANYASNGAQSERIEGLRVRALKLVADLEF